MGSWRAGLLRGVGRGTTADGGGVELRGLAWSGSIWGRGWGRLMLRFLCLRRLVVGGGWGEVICSRWRLKFSLRVSLGGGGCGSVIWCRGWGRLALRSWYLRRPVLGGSRVELVRCMLSNNLDLFSFSVSFNFSFSLGGGRRGCARRHAFFTTVFVAVAQ